MRPTLNDVYVQMLKVYATRGTCARRQVAAIVVDAKGRFISAGYNGVPPGWPHCTEVPCVGAKDVSGDTSRCMATHAEANALLQAGLSGRLADAATLYCSASPCFSCAKMIASTAIKWIIYIDLYPDAIAIDFMKRAGIYLYRHEER